MISRMATDTATDRPAKSFLTSCVKDDAYIYALLMSDIAQL